MIPRILEVFAKRGLVPTRVYAVAVPNRRAPEVRELSLDIQAMPGDGGTRDLIAASLRQIIGVHTVLVATKSRCAG